MSLSVLAFFVTLLLFAYPFAKVLIMPVPFVVPLTSELKKRVLVPIEMRANLVTIAIEKLKFAFDKIVLGFPDVE